MTNTRASFFVRGTPIPKARPRVVRNSKFPRTYTPKTTAQWEQLIAIEYKRQCKGIFFDKSIALKMTFEFVCAGSGPTYSIRGDLDNLIKSCKDALCKVAFFDDGQVIEYGSAKKRRARKGEPTGVHISIEAANEVQEILFNTTPEKVMPWEKTA